MATIAIVLFILLPMGGVPLVLALWPWKRVALRRAVLGAVLVICLVAAVTLDGPWQLWFMTFAPAVLTALVRIADEVWIYTTDGPEQRYLRGEPEAEPDVDAE